MPVYKVSIKFGGLYKEFWVKADGMSEAQILAEKEAIREEAENPKVQNLFGEDGSLNNNYLDELHPQTLRVEFLSNKLLE